MNRSIGWSVRSNAEFWQSGIFFVAPTLTDDDLNTLRRGERLSAGREITGYVGAEVDGTYYEFQLILPLTDYAGAASSFFGDRDLKNPGYSEFVLKGNVSTQGGDVLDIYRVEQRLKYLGFPMFMARNSGANPEVPYEFKVNGVFGYEEATAVTAFYQMTHHANYGGGMSNAGAGAGVVEHGRTGGNSTLDWLNAYNAPHWMNIYDSFGLSYSDKGLRAGGFKDGTDVTFEIYGTSWERDMLKARELQASDLTLNGLWSGPLTLNGLSDPAFGFWAHEAGGHSIGMSIDLGLNEFIDRDTFQINRNLAGANPSVLDQIISSPYESGWSLASAEAWSGYLPDTRAANGRGLNDQRYALRNFLALYAATRDDGVAGNGVGWDDLASHLTNTDARNYLFGTGNGLISHVYIGGAGKSSPANSTPVTYYNPYDGMNEGLFALGIDSSATGGHHNHFHIDLRTPPIRPLPNQLLADNAIFDQTSSAVNDVLRAAAQDLLSEIAPQLAFDQGDLTMFVMDVPPDVPPQYAPIVVAEAKQAKQENKERTIGVCHLVESRPESRLSAVNSMSPFGEATVYLEGAEGVKFDWKSTTWKMTLLEAPKHGTLDLDEPTQSAGYAANVPNFEGDDQATFLVEIGGYKVTVKYFFQVMRNVPGSGAQGSPEEDKRFCPNGRVWKISLNPDDPNSPIYTFEHPYALTNVLAGYSDIQLRFADLPGTALGETTGTTLTLDSDAAGHGWFLDTTPWDNTEYVATSNPNEWVALPGSPRRSD